MALGAIAFTFVTSFASFSLLHRTIGLRSEDAELQGLDIVEHGMYGYPERFIEVPGATPDDALPDYVAAPRAPRPRMGAADEEDRGVHPARVARGDHDRLAAMGLPSMSVTEVKGPGR